MKFFRKTLNKVLNSIKAWIKSIRKYLFTNKRGSLYTVCGNENIDKVKEVADKGVNINKIFAREKITSPEVAMEMAVRRGNVELIRLLIDVGVDVNSRGSEGNTPLHIATFRENETLITMLMNAGADHTIKNDDGILPLHYASISGNKNIVKLLIRKGADVNAKDNYGNTALHYAAVNNNTSMADILEKQGIDIYAKNDQGETALDVASKKNNINMMFTLKKIEIDFSARILALKLAEENHEQAGYDLFVEKMKNSLNPVYENRKDINFEL